MSINQLISKAQQLPNIPKIVQELIQSFGDETVNTDAIAKKIAADQVLTAKVLRMANSARYGGRRKIGSVNDAVVVLGFNALRTLVLASGLTAAFKAPEGFDIKQFWRNSFLSAAIGKWLAKQTKLDAEVAFTCCMMHNIGSLLIQMLSPGLSNQGENQNNQEQTSQNDLLSGVSFTEAGAELALTWQFPNEIVDAIRYQLAPLSASPTAPYANIIYLAMFILSMNSSKQPDLMLNEFPDEAAQAIGLDLGKLKSALPETTTLDTGLEELLD